MGLSCVIQVEEEEHGNMSNIEERQIASRQLEIARAEWPN